MADTSSVSAIIKDGKVTNLATQSTSTNSTANGYDKDAFMKILVAQMKYQDPLEPTSNTEYISQYAQFSQVEQLSNMANSMSLSRASELVGKEVVISQRNGETGQTSEVQGTVDFVTYSGNKAYLNVNGTNYSIEDVTQVFDQDYTDAKAVAEDFMKAIDKLPSNLDLVTEEEHGLTIDTMYKFYMEEMDEKAKNMMDKNYVTSLKQYVNRIDEIRGDEYRTFSKDSKSSSTKTSESDS